MHGSIHLFVALPISMVQEGLRKRLILPGGQYPDHVLHSFAGPAPPLPLHAIAVESVIRFCSTQVDFCMDAALAQAWDIVRISFQIALLFVYLLQIRLCTGMAGEKESIDKIIAEHSAGSLSYKDAGTTSQNNSAIIIDRLPNALGIVKKDAYHQIVKKGVNRKKAINEILQRSPNWPIPEEKDDNLLSAPNVANEENLVKLKRENPTYYQTAADKDLVAYHNVSTGKLREAIKLGGLPMPSLAITKRDIPFGDFGEITLIGDKGMIDPRKSRANEVFSRDAYTVRKPVVNYEEPAKIDSDTFHKKYEETRKFFKKNSIDVGEINFSFQSLNQLEDEAKQKIRVKTRQRNLWIIIAGGALYACISK